MCWTLCGCVALIVTVTVELKRIDGGGNANYVRPRLYRRRFGDRRGRTVNDSKDVKPNKSKEQLAALDCEYGCEEARAS